MRLLFPLVTIAFIVSSLVTSCLFKGKPHVPLAASIPTADLHTTRWVLYTLEAQPITVSPDREIYLQLSATETQVEGQAGCNTFRGSFELPGESKLRFSHLLTTRMACPELSLETRFIQSLYDTRMYRISGDTLRLYGDKTAAPLAAFLATRSK
jgi:heat shock protein HslJ